jgi:hypothetical protein
MLNGFEAIVGQDPHHTAIITLLKKSVCIGDFPDCAASFGAMTIAGNEKRRLLRVICPLLSRPIRSSCVALIESTPFNAFVPDTGVRPSPAGADPDSGARWHA